MATAAATDDTYILPRNLLSSNRLTTQHLICVKRNGWHLHPDIAASIQAKADVEIADVATGNGIFALEVAQQFPAAKVTGLDISPANYPSDWTWPENVSFGLWNVFTPPPEQYCNRFDVVHVRLLTGAAIGKDKHYLLRNLIKLLRPGGWLQWQEPMPHMYSQVDKSFTVLPGMSRLGQLLEHHTKVYSASGWFADLPTYMVDEGLVNPGRHDAPLRRHIMKQETDLVWWTLVEAMDGVRARGVTEQEGKEISEAENELSTNIGAGQVWTYIMPTFIGRRP